MFTTREILIFLAGAEAFHTLSHLIIAWSGTLPIKFFGVTWDKQSNLYGIIINAVITAGLLWLAYQY